jgi:hypothetical protein
VRQVQAFTSGSWSTEQNAFVSDALAASVAHHLQDIMRASGTHDETSRALLRLAAN